MAIVKWEPLSEFDRFFDNRLLSPFSFPPLTTRLGWDLAVDLYEEKGNIIAKMTLPGVEPADLDVAVEKDTLRISGHRNEEKETKNKDYFCKEIRRGSFSRVVDLPKSVDSSKAVAEYREGVLQVTMPVTGGPGEKAVKIKVRK